MSAAATILEIIATVSREALPEVVNYIRGESDHRPPELAHVPESLEVELSTLRMKGRRAAAARPNGDHDSDPNIG